MSGNTLLPRSFHFFLSILDDGVTHRDVRIHGTLLEGLNLLMVLRALQRTLRWPCSFSLSWDYSQSLHFPIRILERFPMSPKTLNSQRITAITTTAFKILFMVACITISFCLHNTYICCCFAYSLNVLYRYFGQNTTWYLHSRIVCDSVLNLLIMNLPFSVPFREVHFNYFSGITALLFHYQR